MASKKRRRKKGRVWPGALSPSTKRQQYKWRQLVGRLENVRGISDTQRQILLDEGYKKIFHK
jgi:hypothetical protein